MTETKRAGTPPVDDDACFACGTRNPAGLGLRFEPDGSDGACATVVLDAHLQGYRGIAHGGIVMLLLDEVMAHASGNAGDKVMTASVSVRFRGAVPTGAPLTVTGRVLSKRGKVLKVEGTIRNAAGTVLASGEGSFVSVGAIEPGRFSNRFAPPAV